eukprot:TRINITY_DN11563_c0_g2_i3.p1 TRINITY_DN11563_c0_g2~~TRINITY_DN11563_c0_g2_i3.p1  ORF type:complete len:154 (+),score=39.79 TRINITY_DN11563_c0_g2_i3:536-997(+)
MRCSSGSKAAVNYFARVVAHVAFGNSEYINTAITYALRELRTAECNRMKEILRIVFLIFANKDKDTSKYAAFFSGLPNCLKAGAKCYRVFECFIDFVIKIFRSAEIGEELRTHSKTLKVAPVVAKMEEWLRENPNPGTMFMVLALRMSVGTSI